MFALVWEAIWRVTGDERHRLAMSVEVFSLQVVLTETQ